MQQGKCLILLGEKFENCQKQEVLKPFSTQPSSTGDTEWEGCTGHTQICSFRTEGDCSIKMLEVWFQLQFPSMLWWAHLSLEQGSLSHSFWHKSSKRTQNSQYLICEAGPAQLRTLKALCLTVAWQSFCFPLSNPGNSLCLWGWQM